ncbi:hypothetical protein S40293_02012 [Stachybotrys chartarum IBT 40293]|nr:hypothetical protein S40293_02012 [Stachybotrys chartarum IBT 40293]
MASDDDDRSKKDAVAADEPHDLGVLFNGTPEEKVRAWLHMFQDEATDEWPSSPMQHTALHTLTPTSVTFAYTVQADHCNRMANLHGGCTATVFDALTSLALCLVNRPGFWSYLGVTRNLNVAYLRPVPLGANVLVECRVLHVGRRLVTLTGVMRARDDGSVLATCHHDKVNTDPAQAKL